ncbi:MAG TPA: serine hydrolase domain-containing protein [Blastocatellia bacterium]|nr:serine hydrolase domain-containing protein [Blastocatellia bacterium]
MLRRFLGVILLLCLSAGPATLAVQEQPPDFSQLERVLLDELKETNTPGATVAIISGDRIIYKKAFGISNVETGAPMTPEMLFRIGSTTKMFTALALVTLAEQGKLKLDEPIGKHVNGLNPRIAGLTAHQLLTHTSGMIDEAPMYGEHDDSAMGRTIRSWKEDQLFTEPGKIISYSNPGYWLAGFTSESISKKPFADHMSESIFKPLGMTSSTFRPTVAMTYPLAQGHNASGGTAPTVVRPFADNSASWPAGSMFSNVLDLSRFIIAFMNDGKLDQKQVLSPQVIAKLSTPQVSIPSQPAAKYGYGLMISTYRGVRVVEHGGSRSGYGSVIKMAPDHRFAVIVLGNRTGVALNKTAEKAMELMLPLKPKDDDRPNQDLPMTAAEMAHYVGKYGQREANVEILLKDGKLFLKQGQNERPIRKVGENRFAVGAPNNSTPMQFTLVTGSDGKAEYFHAGLRASRRM